MLLSSQAAGSRSAKGVTSNMRLNRSVIVKAAFAVLDKEGLDGLSLRLVAERLHVQTPALYWHVHNKAELLDLMAATLSVTAARAELKERGWGARLIAYARTLRTTMLKHRDSARLRAMARPIEDPELTARRLATPLIETGLDGRRALSYQAAVIAYTLGWVAYEQNQSMREHIARMLDIEESFDAGLRAMVHGFAAENSRNASRRKNSPPP
jgi:TetR/AcrR family tetracycline transcriptional repressor